MRSKLTPRTIARIKVLRDRGWQQREIARRVALSIGSVNTALRVPDYDLDDLDMAADPPCRAAGWLYELAKREPELSDCIAKGFEPFDALQSAGLLDGMYALHTPRDLVRLAESLLDVPPGNEERERKLILELLEQAAELVRNGEVKP